MNNADKPAMPTERLKRNDVYQQQFALDKNASLYIYSDGLTKREHFAAMAMQGICAAGIVNDTDDCADNSVRMADSLLKALEPTNE